MQEIFKIIYVDIIDLIENEYANNIALFVNEFNIDPSKITDNLKEIEVDEVGYYSRFSPIVLTENYASIFIIKHSKYIHKIEDYVIPD